MICQKRSVPASPPRLYGHLIHPRENPVNTLVHLLTDSNKQMPRHLNRRALDITKLTSPQTEAIKRLLILYAVPSLFDDEMLSIRTVLNHLHQKASKGDPTSAKNLYQLGAPTFSDRPAEPGILRRTTERLCDMLDRATLGTISEVGKSRRRQALKAAYGFIRASDFRQQQLHNLTTYPPVSLAAHQQIPDEPSYPESDSATSHSNGASIQSGLLAVGLVGAAFLVNTASGMHPPTQVELSTPTWDGSGQLNTACDFHCPTGDCPLSIEVSQNSGSLPPASLQVSTSCM